MPYLNSMFTNTQIILRKSGSYCSVYLETPGVASLKNPVTKSPISG